MDEAEDSDPRSRNRSGSAKEPFEPNIAAADDLPARELRYPALAETQELPTADEDLGSDSTPERRRPPWKPVGTPTAPVEASPERTERRPSIGRWIVTAIALAALLLATFSLAINLLLIRELGMVREEARDILDEAIVGIEGATLGEVAFSYLFSDTIVYSGTIPVDETVVFPFQGTVPFQGRVPFQGVVPITIDIPLLGAQVIRVPINTSVNVDTAVDVSTTVTIPISMDFPFNIELPVEMPVDITISLDEQPALAGVLQQLQDILVDFRDRLLQDANLFDVPIFQGRGSGD
jgi:hypothetical protein